MALTRRPLPAWALRVAFAATLVSLGGCSTVEVPYAENHPATGQKTARAVHHWDVLADDVAGRIAGKISEWPAGEYPIHVAPPPAGTGFDNGFRKLLITRLLDRGVPLSLQPTAVTLSFETQVVPHRPGLQAWTRLAPGVGVTRDEAAWVAHAQAGAISDLTQYAISSAVRTEVLITTSLESGDRFLARTADIYYIDRDDVPLYLAPPPSPPPAPVKTWKVVAP